jgi:hypothetical protein
MEKQLTIVFGVNNEEHAELIRLDILKTIQERTVIFNVSDIQKPVKFVNQLTIEER